jgi:hypothetical protein
MAGNIIFCSDCAKSIRRANDEANAVGINKLVYDLLRSVAWECQACRLDAHRTTTADTDTYLKDRLEAIDVYKATLPVPNGFKADAVLGIVNAVAT